MFEFIVDVLNTILSAIGWKKITDEKDDATSWKNKTSKFIGLIVVFIMAIHQYNFDCQTYYRK